MLGTAEQEDGCRLGTNRRTLPPPPRWARGGISQGRALADGKQEEGTGRHEDVTCPDWTAHAHTQNAHRTHTCRPPLRPLFQVFFDVREFHCCYRYGPCQKHSPRPRPPPSGQPCLGVGVSRTGGGGSSGRGTTKLTVQMAQAVGLGQGADGMGLTN
ncbi:hypothetical protein HJG60_010715 [Phyllostomus discolor]|uniref:Uncharacterized protein n=1 Tax=Phyllostomus discolor TaxID=89673 RepID=A0A834ALW5_9CHIR|nr:hypothetical protein HJG60_010715 [Phyllostomus discolor]